MYNAIEQFNGGKRQLPLANKENVTITEAGADVPTAGGDDLSELATTPAQESAGGDDRLANGACCGFQSRVWQSSRRLTVVSPPGLGCKPHWLLCHLGLY